MEGTDNPIVWSLHLCQRNVIVIPGELWAYALFMKAAATKVFHRPPANLNCAQAVIHAYGSVSGDHSHPVAEFADCGGGHAPDAICGALYAACQMAPESGETLTLGFVQRIGSNTCYKTGDGLRTCEVRVETAAEMLEATLMGETSQRLRIAIPMRDAAFSEHFGGATDFRMSDVNRQTKRIFRQTEDRKSVV